MRPFSNKILLQRVRQLLREVRSHHDLAISCIKAHLGLSTTPGEEADDGNSRADQLAGAELAQV